MSDSRGRQARRGVQLLGAALAAGLLLLSVVLPALAAAVGPTKLEHPSVDPRTGSTTTQFTLRVTYRSNQNAPPEYVRVVVGSTTYEMTGAGTDWKGGVVFTMVTSLPAGAMGVVFQARDVEKFVDEADGGAVTITPAPTPAPTSTPVPTPTPTPTPSPPTPTPVPTPTPTPTPTPSPPATAPVSPLTGGTASGSTSGGAGAVDGSWPGPSGTDDGSAIGGAAGGSSGGGSGTSGSGGSGTGGSGSGTSGQPGGTEGIGANTTGGSTSPGSANDPFASWLDAPSGAGIAELGLSGGGRLPTLPAMVESTTAVLT